jgi:hypothetical protein
MAPLPRSLASLQMERSSIRHSQAACRDARMMGIRGVVVVFPGIFWQVSGSFWQASADCGTRRTPYGLLRTYGCITGGPTPSIAGFAADGAKRSVSGVCMLVRMAWRAIIIPSETFLLHSAHSPQHPYDLSPVLLWTRSPVHSRLQY